MQKLTLLAPLVLVLLGCGAKEPEASTSATPPKRMTLEEADKVRPNAGRADSEK